jgi:hypothetical protein
MGQKLSISIFSPRFGRVINFLLWDEDVTGNTYEPTTVARYTTYR